MALNRASLSTVNSDYGNLDSRSKHPLNVVHELNCLVHTIRNTRSFCLGDYVEGARRSVYGAQKLPTSIEFRRQWYQHVTSAVGDVGICIGHLSIE